jgi:hypothetical protein
MEPTSLRLVVADLKRNLEIYLQDAIDAADNEIEITTPQNLTHNEWALQIAEIYEAAYGEELNLTLLALD